MSDDDRYLRHFARIFDVPTWLLGAKRPRFARWRWKLRRVPLIGRR